MAPDCWRTPGGVLIRGDRPPTSGDLVTIEQAVEQLRTVLEEEQSQETPAQRAHREEGRARLARLQARSRARMAE